MNGYNTSGFTIIEVILFLGVSAVLTMALLVGSGVAIGQQRYRDSVTSLKVLVQDQYSQVNNVVNSRTGEESCSGANIVQPPANVPQPDARGTTDCIIVGRLLTIAGNGSDITTSTVVAHRSASVDSSSFATDVEELNSYNLAVSPIDQEKSEVAWGSYVTEPGSDGPEPLSMLIIRSPRSGSVMTYTSPGATSDVSSLITNANASTARNLCVVADNGTFMGNRMAVRINGYATSQSAIEIPSESEAVCV